MPALKTYSLFISHAWQYNEDYNRLVQMLDGAKRFRWMNHSVPEERPKDSHDDDALLEALGNQLRPTGCVLVISGMYVAYRDWVQREIDLAAQWGKPMIGIKPRGSMAVPREVSSAAEVMVRWHTPSIVSEVRKRAST